MNATDETVDATPLAVTLDAPGESVAEGTITVTREQPGRYLPPGADPSANELGRGGIGRVLVVRDAHLSREVALKELLTRPEPGSAASGRDAVVLTRFLREARITGQLEHPNIVPVYELGQRHDGTLYYTMKVVRGRTLADALAECDGLSDRLPLLKHFADLCNAMAYAHARGVIHRDLKPGNVMLGEFGETVLLDWGLARPVDEAAAEALDRALSDSGIEGHDPAATTEGAVLGTPLYMSPEQARGVADLDPRADVWSLGVMLYELVTGQRPFQGRSVVGVLTAVTSGAREPVRAVTPDAPPELAAVIERALHTDRDARYADAGELAAEVTAFLMGDRVRAYRYGLRDVLARFARRHVVSLAVAAIAVCLLVGLGVWAHMGVRGERDRAMVAEAKAMAAAEQAREAERAATAARDDAEGLVQYMVGDLRQTLEPLGRLDLLDGVVARVSVRGAAEADPQAEPSRARSRADTQFVIAMLAAARGMHDDARAAATESHRLRAGLVEAAPSPRARLHLARSTLQLAALDRQIGDRPSAQRRIEAALAELTPLAEGGDPEARHSRAEALQALGELRSSGGDLEAAEDLFREALTVRSALVADDESQTRWRTALAEVHDRLGDVRFDRGDAAGALDAYGEARALREALVAARPENLQWVRQLGVSYDQLADVRFHAGQHREALEAWQEAMDRLTRAYAANPSHLGWRRDAAIARLKMADGLAALGRTAPAARSLAGVVDDLRDLAARNPDDIGWARDLNVARWRRADLLVQLGQLDDAAALLDAALADAATLVKRVPGNATYRHDHAVAHLERGDLALKRGALVPAAVAYRTAARELGRLAERDPNNATVAGDRAVAHRRLTAVLGRSDLDRAALWRAVREAETREMPMPDAPADAALAAVGRGGGGAPPGAAAADGAADDDEDRGDVEAERAPAKRKVGARSSAAKASAAAPEPAAAPAPAAAAPAEPPAAGRAMPRDVADRMPAEDLPAEEMPTADMAAEDEREADARADDERGGAFGRRAEPAATADPMDLLDDPLLSGVDVDAAPADVRPWIGTGDRAAPRTPIGPAPLAPDREARPPRDPARRPVAPARNRSAAPERPQRPRRPAP